MMIAMIIMVVMVVILMIMMKNYQKNKTNIMTFQQKCTNFRDFYLVSKSCLKKFTVAHFQKLTSAQFH